MDPIPLPLTNGWMHRLVVGANFPWAELWASARTHPDFPAWQQLHGSRGVKADAGTIKYYMTRGLIREVMYAASGVERELHRLEAALVEAQAWVDERVSPLGGDELKPTEPMLWGTPSMADASYAFINLLTWARTVRERVDRKGPPKSGTRVGLLPALRPVRLRDRIAKALLALDQALRGTRDLANYALHAGNLPNSSSPMAEVEDDGQILFLIPDPVSGRIITCEQFTFDQRRDALTYGRSVMQAVAAFMDEMLAAFEASVPKRVRAARPGQPIAHVRPRR